MYQVNGDTINDCYIRGMQLLKTVGSIHETRNGPARVINGPVMTLYTHPYQRVLFDADRDANPFFHVMEALWMLAGRRDVEFPARYAKQILQYAEDDGLIHGAYGFRWRQHFCVDGGEPEDQIDRLIELIWANPDDRRLVLTMWDPVADLGQDKKDIPCNTHIYFRVIGGSLDMTVCNRSNDIIWGLYGANHVHFSFLQEYLAYMTGNRVGRYFHMSNNFHAYTDIFDKKYTPKLDSARNDVRFDYMYPHFLLIDNGPQWDHDLQVFLSDPVAIRQNCTNRFFPDVASPMALAWEAWKVKDFPLCRMYMTQIKAIDWRKACEFWISRREAKHGISQTS
jgi:thymidylate synthase